MDKLARKLLTSGIFAIDKPKNVYSMRVVENLKDIIVTQVPPELRPPDLKMGHSGILDFSASGVMVIGVGHGCRQLKKFLHGDKSYVVIGKLGEETNTFNNTGAVTDKKSFDHITKSLIDSKLRQFQGEIWQTPPKYSALKRNGRRVSDLVLEGQEVEMSPRKVFCHEVFCTRFKPPFFELEVICGGGFYVRSLVHDLGKELGSCAHVTDLRRTRQGNFLESDALPESEWNANNILKAIFYSKSNEKEKNIEMW